MAHKLLSEFVSDDGNGAGDHQITGNYAGAPVQFYIRAQASEVIHVHRVIGSIEASTINNASVYATAGLLTNGVKVYVTDNLGTIMYWLTDQREPVVNLGQWAHYCFDHEIENGLAGGDDHFVFRWSFDLFSEHGVELYPGWSLVFLVEDDFSLLSAHHFLCQGEYVNVEVLTDAGHA